MSNWCIEDGTLGVRFVLEGPISREALRAMRAREVCEIELNYAKGWVGSDYSWLSEFSELKVVEIIDRTTNDVGVVNEFHRLRRLSVQTYCKTALEFSNWPHLEECSIEWRPKARSLYAHQRVRSVFVNRWNDGTDLQSFGQMKQLESLKLYSPSKLETLAGVDKLRDLRWLEIARATRLKEIEALGPLVSLEHLEFYGCRKFGSIAAIRGLIHLRELFLIDCGDLASLDPIGALSGLERLLFYESTNVLDGDLSVLEALPRLRDAAFAYRRHYSHRQEDLELRGLSES